MDQDNLRRKNEELAQAFRDKSRKNSQTQELYDKLKRRVMLGQVQNAASDAVDHTIHASGAANRLMDPTTGFDHRPRQSPLFSGTRRSMMRQSNFPDDGGDFPSMPPPVARSAVTRGRNGSSDQENNNQR